MVRRLLATGPPPPQLTLMPQRKTRAARKNHRKSKHGCASCKKRHLKCDEQRPSCAGCTIRSLPCVYAPLLLLPEAANQTESVTASSDVDGLSRGATHKRVLAPKMVANENGALPLAPQVLHVQSPYVVWDARRVSPQVNGMDCMSSLSAVDFSCVSSSSATPSDRLLELELLHCWTTHAWMGLYIHIFSDCQSMLKQIMPQAALGYDFLLNGIFAVAASDIATRTADAAKARSYEMVALRYANRSSEQFRRKLLDFDPTEAGFLYFFAVLAASFDFSIGNRHETPLDRLDSGLALVVGKYPIPPADADMPGHHPEGLALASRRFHISQEALQQLDAQTWKALARLSKLAGLVRVPVAQPQPQPGRADDDGEWPLARDVPLYRDSIWQMERAYAEDLDHDIKGFFLTVICVGGAPLTTAIAEREPMALVIALYFSVLMDRSGRFGMIWWVGSLGRDLVRDISDKLRRSHIGHLPDVQEAMKWAKDQVDLAPPSSMVSAVDNDFARYSGHGAAISCRETVL